MLACKQCTCLCYSHNDVVDGDVNEFNEETNETHDGKPDSCGHGDLLELWRWIEVKLQTNN